MGFIILKQISSHWNGNHHMNYGHHYTKNGNRYINYGNHYGRSGDIKGRNGYLSCKERFTFIYTRNASMLICHFFLKPFFTRRETIPLFMIDRCSMCWYATFRAVKSHISHTKKSFFFLYWIVAPVLICSFLACGKAFSLFVITLSIHNDLRC